MSIVYSILGALQADNALYAKVETGQSSVNLLFDCGEACLHELSLKAIREIDHLLFSHLHMDHVAGFDTFVRCRYADSERPVSIWGPPDTARIIQNRLRGYMWNLVSGMKGTWLVHEIGEDSVETKRLELSETFETLHHEETQPLEGRRILEHADLSVQAFVMNHGTPSIAYLIEETSSQTVNTEALEKSGLIPGPWIKELKRAGADSKTLEVGGIEYSREELRSQLLTRKEGDSLAYLTDFLFDEAAQEQLPAALANCQTIVCECQYADEDLALARANYHMTSSQAAQLAADAKAGRLLLFHVSQRYTFGEALKMLEQARRIFPRTDFAESWTKSPAWASQVAELSESRAQ